MGFKISRKENLNFNNPKDMYKDYKNRTINGLLDYQTEMINTYMEKAYNKSDVALELPTGSGKTLIGLIIGEYRRRKDKQKIVYLCPNNQLVHQVALQASNKYGIKVDTFTGKFRDYDPKAKANYTRGETIAITNYSSLFNNSTFFNDADILIFDDAHSAENYISSHWNLEISRYDNKILYQVLTQSLKDSIDTIHYNIMINDDPIENEKTWIDKVPNINMISKLEGIINIIDEHVKNTDLQYSWTNIKNNLHACNIFLSWDKISIRPFIPPTLTHEPFKNAVQRIYMSATLGVSGELERIMGVKSIERLPIVNGWNEKGLGRRFFIFPQASFNKEKSTEVFLKANELVERSLVLVTDGKSAEKVSEYLKENTDKEIFTIKDIETSKHDFINSNNGIAVLANRFDGIDLPDDECRLLTIVGLPIQTHLQEKFFTTRMAASVLFKERIKTRIIQAIGRCTRRDVDYSAILILDEKLQNELITKNKLKEYHPELQAEINFGYEQSEGQDDVDQLINLMALFFKHGKEWEGAEEEIINQRENIIKEGQSEDRNCDFNKLLESSKYEVEFQYALLRKDFEHALKQIESIITILQGENLKGYRGFWNYTAGYTTYLMYCETNRDVYFDKSKKYMKDASLCTKTITWFNKLLQGTEISITAENDFSADIIERIETEILKDGTSNNKKFENKVAEILELLQSNSGEKFEDGHYKLGNLLGYISNNAKGDSDPDPWWIINENICIVSEDKIYATNDKPIPTKHVRQACGHENWIKEKVNILKVDADIYTIMITNSEKIEESAAIHGKNIWYINKSEFIDWAVSAIESIRKLRSIFIEEGNLIWRAEAMKILNDYKVTPKDFLKFIKRKSLDQLDRI